jgi:Tfp pilus assembly protein PilX
MKQFLRQKKLMNNEKGMALVVVLMVLVVTSIMGVTLLELSANSIKKSSVESNYQSSYYIAESGATYMMNDINKNIMTFYNQSPDQITFFNNVESMLNSKTGCVYNDFETSFGQQPRAVISLQYTQTNSDSRTYNIISVGTIGNSSRTVIEPFTVKWIPKNTVNIPTDKVLFVKTNIDFNGNVVINGSIGTNSANSIISLGGNVTINGSVGVNSTVPGNSVQQNGNVTINGSVVPVTTNYNFLMPVWVVPSSPVAVNDLVVKNNNNYNLTMNQDMAYQELSLDNSTMIINVGNTPKNLIVNNLTMSNSNILVNGTGKLTIFVKGNVNISGNSTINTQANTKNLQFIVKGSSITTSGNSQIYASLYADSASITVNGNNGFEGDIIAGGTDVEVSGNTGTNPRLFYAPNADVNLTGNTDFTGAIIANSFQGKGNHDFTFVPVDMNSISLLTGNSSGGTASISDIVSAQRVQEK